ncbi:MAG: hypothetical protein CMD81_13135 [Gammaproteobacteria bacterium]|nr:hypothetical protein [Gammaproteobacteria bacterium]|tara:strand:+ start:401 stop:613 length:213 start_codon:yes stop_codon:yes gene_type:complete
MESVKLLDSDAWLSIVKDRPEPPPVDPQNTVAMQQYAAEMFEWTFSISLAAQGMTSDKNISDKIVQNLSR